MKKIICVLLLLALAGCAVISREDKDVKGVGISQEKAQETIDALDAASK